MFGRNYERKARAFVDFTLDLNLPSHLLYHGFAETESEPCAFPINIHMLVQPVELNKKLLHIFL